MGFYLKSPVSDHLPGMKFKRIMVFFGVWGGGKMIVEYKELITRV